MNSSEGLGGVKRSVVPMRSKTGDPRRHCRHDESGLMGRARRKRGERVAGRQCPHVEELSPCSYRELDGALGCTFWWGPSCWASGDRELNCGREKDTPSTAVFSMFSVPTRSCWAGLQSAEFFREMGRWRRRRRALPEGIGVYSRGGLASLDATGPAGRLETLGELRSKAVCWQNFHFFEEP